VSKLLETTMAIRFFGDDLDPDEITARLGCLPTFSAKKGGIWATKGGTEKTASTGFWRLVARDRQPGDLDAQISELLASCSEDLSIWIDLTNRFTANVFCGLFMNKSNDGAVLSVESMQKLGSRQLPLWFDIYDPPPQD
jgi:hypothetical protein